MRYCIRYNIVLSKGPIVSSMIYRLARACYRHAGRVIALWVLVLAVLAGLTATVGGNFDDQFRIPGATSQTALDQMRMTFPQAAESSASVLVLAPKGETVNTPSVRAAIEAHAAKMTDLPWVSYVMLPYDFGAYFPSSRFTLPAMEKAGAYAAPPSFPDTISISAPTSLSCFFTAIGFASLRFCTLAR